MKNSKAINFDRVAWIYDKLARLVFGSTLEKSQIHFLDHIIPNQKILIIGGGSGFTLKYILENTNPSQVVFIDSSAKMISLAKERIKNLDKKLQHKVEFRCTTEEGIKAEERFDIICTQFFLDLFTEEHVSIIIKKLTLSSLPGTQWYFTDFYNTPSSFQNIIIKLMLLFFRITAGLSIYILPEYEKYLIKEGWKDMNNKYFIGKMIKSSVLKRIA